MVDVMRRKKVISEEDADGLHCTKEDEDRLKKVLVDNWDSLEEYDRAICHALNGTLPSWGKSRPPTEEYTQRVKETTENQGRQLLIGTTSVVGRDEI
jgi:hypothetical protein